ncbi:MAG: hypothetical protein H6945_18360 [Zoogloeaceae bacterium]|nr:hypothetical protein [Rhodocyclaceae bacterium]MCP5237701.1 hypothetical protein [Zoogloeaceae bacterium]
MVAVPATQQRCSRVVEALDQQPGLSLPAAGNGGHFSAAVGFADHQQFVGDGPRGGCVSGGARHLGGRFEQRFEGGPTWIRRVDAE